MQPSDGFWEGVGKGVADSPWWALLGLVLIIGLFFLAARYIYPGHKEIKMRELDIREREAENDRARTEANRALAEQTRGMKESVDILATQQAEQAAHLAEQTARLNESASRSRQMGDSVTETNSIVKRLDHTTEHTDDLVTDIHRRLIRGEGTD